MRLSRKNLDCLAVTGIFTSTRSPAGDVVAEIVPNDERAGQGAASENEGETEGADDVLGDKHFDDGFRGDNLGCRLWMSWRGKDGDGKDLWTE